MNLRNLYRGVVAALALLVGSQAFAARTTTYFHNDGLGSAVAATNQAGEVMWRKSYAPFGAQLDTPPVPERTSYTGKQHDDVTGLTYFGGRNFDPELGRFTSIDPVAFTEANTMSFNRYLYVNNNPYKYVDPDGEVLNFMAKFVLDVAINVAVNYITTGEMNVGGALKESALGILNPIPGGKAIAKLAMHAKKADKVTPDPRVSAVSTTRVRHYTNNKGADGIESSGVIKAQDSNRVFAESAKRRPLPARQAEEKYGIGRGRGKNYVETDVPTDKVSKRSNPLTGADELVVKGDVPLSNSTVVRRP